MSLGFFRRPSLVADAFFLVRVVKYMTLLSLIALMLLEAATDQQSAHLILILFPVFVLAALFSFLAVAWLQPTGGLFDKNLPGRREYVLYVLTALLVLANAPNLPPSATNLAFIVLDAVLLFLMTLFVWYFSQHRRAIDAASPVLEDG